MKKIFTLLTILISANIIAQTLTNSDLENWVTEDSYEIPQGWETSNEASSQWNNTLTCEKTTDAYSGSYAAKLTSKNLLLFFTSPGFITTGRFEFNAIDQSAELYGGNYFPHRPEKITGYFKYSPGQSGDNCVAGAFLLKYSGGSISDTVGKAEFYETNTVNTYTYFEADFQYFTQDTPDSLQLTVLSTDFDNPVGQSVMYIDDLSIQMPTGHKINLMDEENISIYPNPANNFTYIECEPGSKITIIDMTGKIITEQRAINNKTKIDTENLPDSNYIVNIKSGDNESSRILQIN